MLDTLKQAGKNIGREINRAWENLSEGWRELLTRSSEALTHFKRDNGAGDQAGNRAETSPGGALAAFPRWSLLAGEVEETGKDVVVRVELPGMDKDDCSITIEGNTLYISGEKHFESETIDSTYHIMERAYGSFQRAIPLPRNVDIDKAEAGFKNGVLTIRLPKVGAETAKTIRVS